MVFTDWSQPLPPPRDETSNRRGRLYLWVARRQDSDLPRPCAQATSARGVREPHVEHVASNRAAGVFDHKDGVAQALDAQTRPERIEVRVGGDGAPVHGRS